MKLLLERDILNKLNEKLFEINKKNNIPNNFIRIKKVDSNFQIEILANNTVYKENIGLSNEMFYSKTLNTNIFNHRDNFIGLVTEECIEVNTSGELHLHTGYSLLDGMIRIPDLVKKSSYVSAITDHGVMYGCLDFYKRMKSNHKKPIIGFEAYTESITGDEYKLNKKGNKILKNNHLILLAKNEKGYRNLSKLNSLGQKAKAEDGTSRPRIKYEWLKEYSDGIICLTACLGGEIPTAIAKGDIDRARAVLEKLISIFGKDNLYLEVQRHKIQEEEIVTKQMKIFAKEYDLKLVATTDAHYLNKEDSSTHEAQLCLQTGKQMSDNDRWRFPGEGYYYHTCEEKEELFNDMPEALFNSLEIADKCNFEYKLGVYKLPKFPIPEGKTENEYFRELCWQGFESRFPKGTEMYSSSEYRERLEFEMETIIKMGYPAYFLIVWDFIKYAKDNNIGVGPGRGSACGSLVAYVLEITDMDPIPYGLLFERFLNPDRISMPDIDSDFNNFYREDVINYCRLKYGADAVSKIITFGTLASKNSIADTARVWGKSVSFARSIMDKIPSAPKMTIAKALEESYELKEMYDNDEEVRDIIDKARKIEGLPRNISQHACGLIICSSAVTDYCPQVYVKNKETGLYEGTIQCTMSEAEELGMLKMDFLGLKTMSVLQEAINDINLSYGKNLTLEDLSITDPKVYEHISKGYTKGVFQLEGAGMTSFIKDLFQDVHSRLIELKAKNATEEQIEKFGEELFERLIAGISLYRPGPIGEIPNYIRGMLDSSSIKYDTPQLESILKTTYGVIVYQEQAMMAVRELAGFSKGQADTIRKGMAKKKEALLEEYGKYFVYGSAEVDEFKDDDKKLNIKGCINLGIPEEVAITIWDKMKAFGAYAFNKSHAGGYATISVKTAWLSYYYPAIFVKANLNVYISNPKKVKAYLADAYKKNIKLLPPSVNKSDRYFTVEGENAIRFGLKGIKNVGATSDLIIQERTARGEFKSYQDFAERLIIYRKMNKNVLESLVLAGALDEFEGTRKAKLAIIDKLINSSKIDKKAHETGQMTIFDLANDLGYKELSDMKIIKLPTVGEFDKKVLLESEKEYNGYYITEHPLDSYADVLKDEHVLPLYELLGADDEDDMDTNMVMNISYNNKKVKVAGVIRDVKTLYTKNGKPYKKFILEDTTGEIECKLFNLEKNSELIQNGERVIMTGKFQDNEYGVTILTETISDLSVRGTLSKEITVVSNKDTGRARLQWRDLLIVAKRYPGNVKIKFLQNGTKHDFPVSINLNTATLNSIQRIFGENNCELIS